MQWQIYYRSSENVTKSAGSKATSMTIWWKESRVTLIFFVVLPLIFSWVILIDNSMGIFLGLFLIGLVWYTHKIQPQALQWESLRNSALIWQSTLLMNKSGKSLGAISKQLQVPRSTVKTSLCKYEARLCHCHHQEERKKKEKRREKKKKKNITRQLVRIGQECLRSMSWEAAVQEILFLVCSWLLANSKPYGRNYCCGYWRTEN